MNLLNKTIFLMSFLLMISVGFSAMCYQEDARYNTSCTGSLIPGGGYGITGLCTNPARFDMGYMTPPGAILAVWQVKYSNLLTHNISIPDYCFYNRTQVTLQAKMFSNTSNTLKKTILYCTNTTGSYELESSELNGTLPYVLASYTKLYDGNWSSGAAAYHDCGTGADWYALGGYGTDFYEEAIYWDILKINSPSNGSIVNGPSVPINFSISQPANYSIYIDGVYNKSVVVSSDSYSENFNIPNGNHNVTIKSNLSSTNITSYFSVASVKYNSISYDTDPYEISLTSISSILEHTSTINITSAVLNLNGTLKNMSITYLNSTHDNASISFITDFIDGTNLTRDYWFYINATANDSSNTISANSTQTLHVAYYINSVSTPSYGTSGELITQNVSVTNLGGIAVATVYANNSEIGNILGTQLTSGTTQNWSVSFNLPTVSVTTIKTIQNYLKVQYGSVLAYRYFNDTNITVYPIEVGLCDGTYTVMILNYSGWNEENNSEQLTTNNNWVTKLDIIAVNGTSVTTLGFNSTGALHQICLKPNFSYYMNVSTYLANNYSNYVRRSHFILNQLMDNTTTNQIKIYLLNASKASIIDLYVKNAFDKVQANRIIKVYKFFPETNSYSELFNLLTDVNGHAVGYLKAYDQWYKLVVVDANGAITKTIPSTQFSTSSYTIIESSEGGTNAPLGVTYVYNWDSTSKIFSATVASLGSNDFKLTLDEVGFYGNTTYCTATGTGTTVFMFCDMSNSSLTDFKWNLWVARDDLLGVSRYYPVAGGEIESVKTPPYGETGLILTGLLTVMASLMFLRDTKIGIIMVMVSLTICRAMQFIIISETALVALWAVALVLIYIMRGDRGG